VRTYLTVIDLRVSDVLFNFFSYLQEQKSTTTESATPPEEELNPFSIFPQPEDNFKVP